MENIIITFISFLCILGLLVSFYIYEKKSKKKKLICPTRNSCDRVVHSSYSKFFGISVENLGITYYIFCGIVYNFIFLFDYKIYIILPILFLISVFAFLFSLRLILIQALIIKKWCAWCITSGIISFLIFILSFTLLKYFVSQ